ncbi:PREDICTED: nuclear receptor subfamily 2 group E member 1-like, partial [Dipodomys ordii]|uniref:Nuclear receptor subfamily 2 group E member 1-like n=1 Tax=Dipodomys ordii TaxID=10020 RepID=A0A1S3GUH0_DIPOR
PLAEECQASADLPPPPPPTRERRATGVRKGICVLSLRGTREFAGPSRRSEGKAGEPKSRAFGEMAGAAVAQVPPHCPGSPSGDPASPDVALAEERDTVQHERGPRTSTIRKQVALYFRGHKEENGAAAHFPSAALPAPAFFTAVTQLEPHGLELAAVSTTPERQTLVSLAQPTPKYPHEVNGTPMYLYEVATESVCESAARLLFMSIKWAKSVPAFSTLSLQDQ